ncbi:MAG TPA: SPOR domain-containing protein [Puia sp.]|nr:SPOR domain-containing protein [Puia sp.]
MHRIVFIGLLFITLRGLAQTDSVVVTRDPRVAALVQKQIEINELTSREARRNVPGFRIQVMNSPDRNKVYAAKVKVYEQFPDLKPYLFYQAPNYKLKVGNFKTQEEADQALQQLSRLFPSGLFVIRDIIEIKLTDTPNP